MEDNGGVGKEAAVAVLALLVILYPGSAMHAIAASTDDVDDDDKRRGAVCPGDAAAPVRWWRGGRPKQRQTEGEGSGGAV